MATTNTVEKLEIIGSSTGLDKLAADLDRVAVAQDNVSDSAKATEVVTERSTRAVVGLQRGLERQARTLDSAYKAQQDYTRGMSLLNKGLEEGAISAATHAQRVQLLNDRYGSFGNAARAANDNLKAANDNIKLTATQVQGLGYQINDVATMLAMGASPFQIIASQAGQVIQVLQDGPGGVTGSLKAVGSAILSLATPTNLIIAGLTAAAGAAIYFAVQGAQKIKPLNEAMEAHSAAIKDIASSYDIAIDASERYESRTLKSFAARRSAAELRVSSRADLLEKGLGGGGDIVRRGRTDDAGRTFEAYEKYAAFNAPLAKLAEGLRAGTDDARAFIDEVARIANLDPANEKLQKIAKDLIDLARPAADAAAQLDAVSKALDRVRGQQLAASTSKLGAFVPDRTSTRDQINAEADKASGLARSYGELMAIEKMRTDALGELDRVEANRRAGYELDVRGLSARTAEEKAAIAADRERLALADENIAQADKERRIEEARSLSLKESQLGLAEAMRARIAGGQAQVDQLDLELGLVGKNAAETARLRAEYDFLTAAKEAARAAGTVVDPAEEAAIREQAARIGELTAATQKLNFERDVQFRIEQAGRSPSEQRIAQEVRGYGEDISTANGQAMAAQLRYVDSVETTRDRLEEMREVGRDAFLEIVDAISSGDNALDALIGGLASFSKQLAAMGAQKLFDGIFGGGAAAGGSSGASGLFGSIGKLAEAAVKPRTATEVFTDGQTYAAAPTIAVERAILPALTQASSSMSAAAKAIRTIESGSASGNYGAIGPVTRTGDRALGAYQMMGANLPEWSRAAIGREVGRTEFLRSVELQDKIFEHRFGSYMAKYGPEGASRAWFAGEGGMKNFKATDVVGTSVSGYGSRFGSLYQQHGGGGGDKAVLRQAVKEGTTDYARSVSSGGAPSLLGNFSPAVQQAFAGGFDGFSTNTASWRPGAPAIPGAGGGGGGASSLSGLLQSPLVQGGLNALSAGAAGYQSGSPVGGALNGALSGFMAGGPIGAVVGGIAGLVGGIFGKSKQKKEAEKARKEAENQKALEASKAWVANLPQFAELIDTVTRTERGSIGQTMKQLNAGIEQFAQLAAETKNATAMSQVEGVRKQIADYGELLRSLFRDTVDPVVADIAAGYGLDTPFAKARDGVRQTADAYRGFIDDVREAYSYDTTKLDTLKADHDKAVAEIEAEKASTLSALSAQNLKALQSKKDDSSRASGNLDAEYVLQRTASGMSKLTEDQEAEYLKQIEEAGTERDEAIAAYESQIAEVKGKYDAAVHSAVMAAREGLLRIVSGDVREQSAVEQALAEARGAAAGLDLALRDLGISADDAAAAIETAIGKRRELLVRDFTEGLTDQIADLDGKGYLADLRELTKSIETMMADANLLNVDTSLVETFFTKQAQAIVDGSELTGDAFDELIALFPDLTGKVHAFADAASSLEEIMARAESYSDRYFAATNDTSTLAGATAAFNRNAAAELKAEFDAGSGAMAQLQAAQAAERVVMIQGLLNQARQEEVTQLENTIFKLESFRDTVKDLRKSLLLDSNLSPLSPEQRFLEAQRQFRDVSAKALAGDPEAQEKLAGVSQAYLEEAKSFYASSEDYYRAFNEVQDVLASAERVAQQQLDAAKAQIEIAKAQLEATIGVKDSIVALSAALVAAQAAAAAAAIKAGATPGGGAGGGGAGGTLFVPQNELQSFLGAQYEAILGRAPDAAGLSYYQQVRNTGATADDIINMIKNSPEAQGRGYSSGGFTGFGGVNDVAGTVHRGEVVWSQMDIARWGGVENVEGMRISTMPRVPTLAAPMAANDGDGEGNSELVEEMRALRAEVRSLKAITAEGAMAVKGSVDAGVAAQQTLAQLAKRNAA